MTTTRATTDADGNTTISTHGTMRSTDYKQEGIEVIRGIGSTTVASPDLLQDDDLITVDGVQLSARAAREYGLIPTAFNPSKSPDQLDPKFGIGTASQAAEEKQRPSTGHEGYDAISSDIMDRVEAGVLEGEEAFEYDLAVATVAGADLTITEVVEIIDGINSGELSALNVDANTRQIAQSVEQRVTRTATKAAINELGQQGFDRLSQMASASSVVDQAIRQYVSMRALGRSSDTWSDFLAMAEDELAGRN
ncbi:hypothetical protein [Tateyamaria sp.]|uniref:hypothetical protein n=1 Tax=Tateyamaria sp. TaxID=1929288 RepID=UPI00329DE2D4